jgi:hypothetical protein
MGRVIVGKFFGLDFDKKFYVGTATARLVRLPFSSSLEIPVEGKSLIHFTGGFLKPEGLWVVVSNELLNQGGNIEVIVPKDEVIENRPPPKTFQIKRPSERVKNRVLKHMFAKYTDFKLVAEK